MGPDQVCAYKIHDNALAVSLLYCTLVVPREILALPKGHQILRDFDKENVVAAFEIVAPTQPTSRQLLLFLRDAVAHACFSIRENDGPAVYEFWTEAEPAFRARIGHDALLRFLSSVGQRITNALQARKQAAGRSSGSRGAVG